MPAPLLLTLGEPAGIGPDCTLLAFRDHPEQFDDVVVAAPPHWLGERARLLGIDIAIEPCTSLDDVPTAAGKLRIWAPGKLGADTFPVTPGRPSPSTAAAVIDAIAEAARACIDGRAAAMVTAPIEKAVLRESGFDFPGHTEFLAHLGGRDQVVMMLATGGLRIALLTTHMALAEVPKALSYRTVIDVIRITHHALRTRFGIAAPKLALCGLNPHAGEKGHFGLEEGTILMPAVAAAREAGIDIEGPLPADTLFSPQMRSRFDTIVCCYHDQGLIPIKALGFGEAVNVTLGLPFIRTSVDHGTALERAATGDVSYSSLIAAIEMARTMAGHCRTGGEQDAD